MRPAGIPAGAGALLVVAATLTAVSSAPAKPAETGFSTFVLGPDGVAYCWRAGESALGPVPSTLAHLGTRPVNDLEISDNGERMVVLLAPAPGDAARHRRHEGLAVVVSLPPAPAEPAILSEIPFDGDGRRVAVSRDGRRAYVLAIRPAPEGSREPPRSWLHALDTDAGRVESSAQLDRPPGAIALDPSATRLYLAYAGRIVSYTTRPLARSWHYRSPGANRGLYFRPQSAILHAVRMEQVALFDPGIIAALKPEQRQEREDDATALVSLPFTADTLLFSQDGLLVAALGPGNRLVFIDAETSRVFAAADDEALDPDQEVRPLYFGAGSGNLAFATFPDKQVRSIRPPVRPLDPSSGAEAAEHAPPAPPAPSPTPLPEPEPTSTLAAPAPPPMATPYPPLPAVAVLAGRLSGRLDVVRSIVVYGPGSIVREQARVSPGADGSWWLPLPTPGTYRIVPLGERSRPVRSEPNFHTVEVKDQGRSDLDFNILGTN